MKVLLVEPNYASKYPPFGLLKISTWLKSGGHEVQFAKGRQKNNNFNPDEIYITTLFTFWYKISINTILYYKKNFPKAKIKVGGIFASLMPDYIERHTGISPHFGLIKEVEDCKPDYSIMQSDVSIAFTSRGCIRKCSFCIVPKIEGDLTDIPNWDKRIDTTKSKITFWDNNFFAKGKDIIKRDADKIRELMKKGIVEVDFNQGLDARLFDEEMAQILEGLPIKPIRFAFDNMSEDGYVQRALELATKYKFNRNKKWCGSAGTDVSVYVLFNYKDKPEDFYYRIREIIKYGGQSFPMRYSPHQDLDRGYVGKYWTLSQSRGVTALSGSFGQISCTSKAEFEFFYGKNAKEFIKIISMKRTAAYNDMKILEWKIKKRTKKGLM